MADRSGAPTLEELGIGRLFPAIADAIIVADDQGKIVSWNPAAERIFGHSASEVRGRSVELLIPDELRERHARGFEAYTRTGRATFLGKHPVSLLALHKDGRLFPVELSLSTFDANDARYFLAIVRDVAQEARLRHHLETLLASIGEGVLGVDARGHVTFSNPAAQALLGHTAEQLIGKHQHALVHHSRRDGTPYPASECPIYLVMQDRIARRVAGEVFWRADGSCFPVEYVSAPIMQDGQLQGAVIVFNDISEQEAASRRLESTIAELSEANKTLEAFSHLVAHDLKEPVRGALYYLDEALATKDPEDREVALQGAMQTVKRLEQLLQGLLAWSRAGAEPVQLEPIRVQDVLEDAACNVMFSSLLVSRTAHLRLDSSIPPILASRTLTCQLLGNLIVNSLRHGTSSQVEVAIRLHSVDSARVHVAIEDNGPGFPVRVLESVRAGVPLSGTGFGLSIAARAAARMGSSFDLSNRDEGGARVLIGFNAA